MSRMNRRVCVAMIVASAVVGVAAAATAATIANHRDDTSSTTSPPASTPPAATASQTPKPASAPTSATTSAAPGAAQARVLGVQDLLHSDDLAAADFPIDKSSTVGSGDEQYAISPCLKRALAGLTNGNVFSGSWYSTRGRAVGESISEAVNDPQAETAANAIVGWHHGTCNDFTVGPQHRVDLDGGWMAWFALTQPSQPSQYVAVYKIGDRIGVLDADLKGVSPAVRGALLKAGADRLR